MTDQNIFRSVEYGTLSEYLIGRSILDGCDHLYVLSGFSSSALVRQLLFDYENLRISLIIGMAGAAGIPAPDHAAYTVIARDQPNRFRGFYYAENPGVHAKTYLWMRNNRPVRAFVSSANFSQSGLHYFQEAAVEADPSRVLEIFSEARRNSISVLENLDNRVRLIPANRQNVPRIRAAHGIVSPPENAPLETAVISLLPTKPGVRMHTKSGLNWGQRDGREPNQAYIPVPASFYTEHPGFLPPRGRRFTVQTDDGAVFTCVVAQDNSKAIETPEDNSELGRYFRTRLGVPQGEFVAREDIVRYGRTSVELTKIDDDLYLMDFSHVP